VIVTEAKCVRVESGKFRFNRTGESPGVVTVTTEYLQMKSTTFELPADSKNAEDFCRAYLKACRTEVGYRDVTVPNHEEVPLPRDDGDGVKIRQLERAAEFVVDAYDKESNLALANNIEALRSLIKEEQEDQVWDLRNFECVPIESRTARSIFEGSHWIDRKRMHVIVQKVEDDKVTFDFSETIAGPILTKTLSREEFLRSYEEITFARTTQ